MAFTLLGFETFKKYVAGAQSTTGDLTFGSNGWSRWTVTSSSYGVYGSKTFTSTDDYIRGTYSSGNGWGAVFNFTEATHLCLGFHFVQSQTYGPELVSGTTPIIRIGGSSTSTTIYVNGSLVETVLQPYAVATAAPPSLVEVYYYLHSSSGVIKVWINRVLVYSFTGNTNFSSGVGANGLRINLINTSGSLYDFYVGSVTSESDRPKRRFTITHCQVNSDTLTTDWTANGGGAHYADLDDQTVCDSATTTITATSPTAKCKFGISTANLPANSTVGGVQVFAAAKRDGAAPDVCQMRVIADSNGTEVQSGWADVLDDQWEYATEYLLMQDDPDTAAAWTLSAVANLDIGVELRVAP